MKKILLIIFLSLYLNENVYAIIGGQIQTADSLISKSTVYIVRKPFPTEVYTCTGVLIAKDIVLTAAHCFQFDTTENIVATTEIIFTHQTNMAFKPAQVRKIKKYENHPDFSFLNYLNDIAIIKLTEQAPESAKSAHVLNNLNQIKVSERLNVAGFGLINDEDLIGSDFLRMASPVIFEISEKLIILDQTDGQGVCIGDSGGPAYLEVDNEIYVVGITKGAFESERCNQKAALTLIPAHLKFINQFINQFINNSIINF